MYVCFLAKECSHTQLLLIGYENLSRVAIYQTLLIAREELKLLWNLPDVRVWWWDKSVCYMNMVAYIGMLEKHM